jgi:hypothetical protein
MNILHVIQELSRNKIVFHSLFDKMYDQVFLWKPAPDKWCLLEILCHLHDEEREDFRPRVQHTLENPDAPMKPIDPAGWVLKRKYIEQDYPEVLNKFMNERDESIKWLNQLKDVPWMNVHHHPNLGDISAEMFLTNWLAHDYLHIRQISRTKYQYLKYISGHQLSYAGEW